MMLQRLLFSLILAVPALALTAETLAKPKTLEFVTYPVRLHPDAKKGSDEKAIEAEVSSEKKCSPSPHDGCMLFTENTVGEIEFYLMGAEKKERCTEIPSTSARRVITKIELSTMPRQDDHTKGVFGEPVDPWLREFAFPGVNPDTGVVYEADSEQGGLTRVVIRNENRHPGDQGRKSFWYKVTVTDCDDPGKKWIFDPRGDNEGLK